jgi:hypothetical protein
LRGQWTYVQIIDEAYRIYNSEKMAHPLHGAAPERHEASSAGFVQWISHFVSESVAHRNAASETAFSTKCRIGDYKILKVLGAGSFAQVAVGQNEKTGDKVRNQVVIG